MGGIAIADVFSKGKRSAIMAKVKGTDTKPEIIVRKYLFSKGYRYRLHDKRYPGRPDIVIPKYRCIIFIHGCFWHGHSNCKYAKLPETNTEFWEKKIYSNIRRDKQVIDELIKDGWHVIVVWECEIKNIKTKAERLKKLEKEIIS